MTCLEVCCLFLRLCRFKKVLVGCFERFFEQKMELRSSLNFISAHNGTCQEPIKWAPVPSKLS